MIAFAIKVYCKINGSFVGTRQAFCQQINLSLCDNAPCSNINLWVENCEATISTTQKRTGNEKNNIIMPDYVFVNTMLTPTNENNL